MAETLLFLPPSALVKGDIVATVGNIGLACIHHGQTAAQMQVRREIRSAEALRRLVVWKEDLLAQAEIPDVVPMIGHETR